MPGLIHSGSGAESHGMRLMRALDDRGRPICIPLSQIAALAHARARSSMTRRPISLVRLPLALLTSPVGLLSLGALSLIGVLLRLLVEDRSMFLGLMIFSPVVMPLLTLSLLTGCAASRFGRELGPRVRDAVLADGRCAACGYDIREIGAAEDGCRVCPECGAAWILPDGDRAVQEVVVMSRKA